MPPEERDPAFLWDMREAAREIAELIAQTDEGSFPEAKLVRFSVERLILVLGEAAARVSDSYRLQHPELPWTTMQQARNLVAHTYGKKVAGSLYRLCREKVLPLSIQLGALVPRPPKDDEGRSL